MFTGGFLIYVNTVKAKPKRTVSAALCPFLLILNMLTWSYKWTVFLLLHRTQLGDLLNINVDFVVCNFLRRKSVYALFSSQKPDMKPASFGWLAFLASQYFHFALASSLLGFNVFFVCCFRYFKFRFCNFCLSWICFLWSHKASSSYLILFFCAMGLWNKIQT